MGKMAAVYAGSIDRALELIRKDIENADYILWEKKIGGDYYWEQVFHAIGSVPFFLGLAGAYGAVIIPEGFTGSLQKATDAVLPHGKDAALSSLGKAKKFVKNFFEGYDERKLLEEIDFYGNPMNHAAIFNLTAAHLMYHTGALDAALRDRGLPSAM